MENRLIATPRIIGAVTDRASKTQAVFGSVFSLNIGGLSGILILAADLRASAMNYDKDKVDEMVLALLFLTLHEDRLAWKGHDWDAMARLHEKGMISDPVGKAKSVVLTHDGLKRCEEMFKKHFQTPG